MLTAFILMNCQASCIPARFFRNVTVNRKVRSSGSIFLESLSTYTWKCRAINLNSSFMFRDNSFSALLRNKYFRKRQCGIHIKILVSSAHRTTVIWALKWGWLFVSLATRVLQPC